MIYYSQPYCTNLDIGGYYNRFMSLLNDDDFACFTDGDTIFTTPKYGHLIERAVQDNPQARLFYARTNRIGCPWQRVPDEKDTEDMRRHRELGHKLAEAYGSSVRQVQKMSHGSGFFMMVRKDLWLKVGGFGSGALGVDCDFFRRVAESGEKIYQLEGVYLYHWYRGGTGDTSHLRPAPEPCA